MNEIEIDDTSFPPTGLPPDPVASWADRFEGLWGVPIPDDLDDQGFEMATRRAVAGWLDAWRVEAVGRRPADHLGRDLMHGSLLRDPRCRSLRRAAKDPSGWLLESVAHLPGPDRAQAAQHLALRAMHLRHLFRLSLCAPLRTAV